MFKVWSYRHQTVGSMGGIKGMFNRVANSRCCVAIKIYLEKWEKEPIRIVLLILPSWTLS
jgi:hypothetical protein